MQFKPNYAQSLWHCRLLLLFSFFYFCLPKASEAQSAQKFTISGYISDASSGERLIGASVIDKRSGQGTVTNTFGFFSLTLPKDSVLLLANYIGYQPAGQNFLLNANLTLNLKLDPSALLKEVEIVGEKYERIENRTQMSRIDVPIQQIKNVPALLGETDVLKVLQLLPGVSGGGEGQSGIYVRGGGPDQNLILLDGVPVYNASHLFGFFSVFNADAIKDVTITKGGFPARYGGRLSSVIEINMKDGNENEYHGEGSIGIIASKLTVEGPIKKGKSSFIISGRRTYIDLLARPLIKAAFRSDGSEGVAGYYFYDFNTKVNYRFSDKDRLYLSFYTGRDKFYLDLTEKDADSDSKYSFNINTGLGWGNLTTAARWNHVLSPKLFMNTTLTYSHYDFNTKAGAQEKEVFTNGQPTSESLYDLKYLSGIDDIAAKLDFDYAPNPDHLIKYGANIILHEFNPGEFKTRIKDTGSDTDESATLGQPKIDASEFAAYGEDDWKITERLRANYGLHFSGFNAKNKTYVSLQPRINMRYLFGKGWALKGSFSTMRQYINLLTNETIGLPTDLWLPTTKIVKPQNCWQVAAGLAKNLGKDYEFSVETYYKQMKNLIAFREGASLFQFSDWQGRVTQGNGTAYGTELFLQKKTGRFSGWIGYTLSWAWRKFNDLNEGNRFPYKYDRRHDFEIVASYKISKRVKVAATWVYSTGNATTLGDSRYLKPTDYDGSYYYGTTQTTHISKRNDFRLNPYHRLDIGVDFTKQKRRHERTWSFGAYNAYSNNNPFFIYLSEDSTYDANGNYIRKAQLKQASLFPLIPYFNYSFKF
ncbi:MAG: TonB-dependent receptor [Bacteroidota bacterium]